MRLYSTVCLGFLIIFVCETQQPVVTDTSCALIRNEVRKLAQLTDAEIAALKRPRKEAILSLRRKYARLCLSK